MLYYQSIPITNDPVDINKLASTPFGFFFKNIKGYKSKFIILTAVSVISTIIGFSATWLLSYIINNINIVTPKNIVTLFLPGYLTLVLVDQYCGYITRRYGEMFPIVYTNHLKLRFLNTWLKYNSNQFINYSKEKLLNYQDKYVAYVNAFLSDWNWGMPRNIARLFIIIGILWCQSPIVLLVNIVYMTLFMLLAARLSKAFIKPVQVYHSVDNDAENIRQNFTINIGAVKKLRNNLFFKICYQQYLQIVNEKMKPVRKVHSLRWLLQMNLFNLVFIATFFYGIYQVINHQLPIGFILLIQYAFNNLLSILIYFVEYHAAYVNQKQDINNFKQEIASINLEDNRVPKFTEPNYNDCIYDLNGVAVKFNDKEISYPEFQVKKGDKIVITGDSGSGKSTLFNILLGQITDYNVAHYRYISNHSVSYVNSTDPLFNISIKDNICLDKDYYPELLREILMSVYMDKKLFNQLDKSVGDPSLNLSTGQIQRVKIARAIYQDTDIYLLDEPFNGIDIETGRRIAEYLWNELEDKTVILITHQYTDVDFCFPEWQHYKMVLNELVKIK